jgi:predicted phosphodiesterase
VRKVIPDSQWLHHFGNFTNFKIQAGLLDNTHIVRHQKEYDSCIVKYDNNASLHKLNEKKYEYAEKYLRPDNKRFQTLLVASDFHGTLCDPFLRACFIDTAIRANPSHVVLNGDVIDCEEFSTHSRNDPRRHRLVEEFKWLDDFLCDIRTALPDTQITYISGNHSNRVLRHLSNESPFIKELLADVHGFTFAKLLGLDKYEINFVSKDDLTVYKESAVRQEVNKNYIVCHDVLAIGHTPQIKKLQMNSIHGHLHQLTLQTGYSYSNGQYSHLGLGCMCMVDAHYAENVAHWNQSFALVHIDTHKKGLQFEVLDCTGDSVMIGGKFLQR